MKKNSKVIWVMLITLSIILINQVTLFARSNDNLSSDSSLSALQIAGGMVLLLLVILLPLVRGTRKEIFHK